MNKVDLFAWVRANQPSGRLAQPQVDAVDTMLLTMSPETAQDILSQLNGWGVNSVRAYNLTHATAKKMYAGINLDAIDVVLHFAPEYGIHTKKQMAAFLATCIIESNGFNAKRESFAYSAKRLTEVFPKSRIPDLEFARKLVAQGQVAIANHLYNGRMGNRVGTNDGWDYRGNSWIQLTGRTNHYIQQNTTGIPVGDNPELLEHLGNACVVTMSWWRLNGLNEKSEKINTYADGYTLNTLNAKGVETKDYKMNTGANLIRLTVNGGYNDYDKFCKQLERCLRYL